MNYIQASYVQQPKLTQKKKTTKQNDTKVYLTFRAAHQTMFCITFDYSTYTLIFDILGRDLII